MQTRESTGVPADCGRTTACNSVPGQVWGTRNAEKRGSARSPNVRARSSPTGLTPGCTPCGGGTKRRFCPRFILVQGAREEFSFVCQLSSLRRSSGRRPPPPRARRCRSSRHAGEKSVAGSAHAEAGGRLQPDSAPFYRSCRLGLALEPALDVPKGRGPRTALATSDGPKSGFFGASGVRRGGRVSNFYAGGGGRGGCARNCAERRGTRVTGRLRSITSAAPRAPKLKEKPSLIIGSIREVHLPGLRAIVDAIGGGSYEILDS